MDNSEKDLRNKKILDLHNQGKSIQAIAKETGLSKGGVHKIISGFILNGDSPKKDVVVKVKLIGDEERFTSFVGYERTDVNQYAHKETGEVVNVAFVKAKKVGEFGYFVKVSGVQKKSTASGDEAKETVAEVLLLPSDAKFVPAAESKVNYGQGSDNEFDHEQRGFQPK